MNPRTGDLRWGRVSYSVRRRHECVRFKTAHGTELTCSTYAPIGLVDGGNVLAPHAQGCWIATRDQDGWLPDEVVSVTNVGEQDIQHITCEDDYYLAGDLVGRYAAHHNLKPTE